MDTDHVPARAECFEPSRGDVLVLMLCMFLSGAAALVYEVAWTRQFTSFIGSSSISMTMVLSALMGGLGLGSWLLGRLVDQWSARQLAVGLGLCELAVALYALLMPWLIESASRLYFGFVEPEHPNLALRASMVVMLVLPPCVVMGGSLPMVSRLLSSGQRWVHQVARVYAANTLGAVLGTVMSGYVLLAWLGTQGTVAVGAVASAGVAALCLLHVAPRWGSVQSKPVVPVAQGALKPRLPIVLLLVLYGVSGAVAMAMEVGWVRSLEMTLGTTTYAFTTMLAAFLLGIVIGSTLYNRLPAKADPVQWLVILQLVIYGGGILSVWCMDRLPLMYFWLLTHWDTGWQGMQAARFGLALLTMLIPTVAMGMLFPLMSRLIASGVPSGRSVGSVYAFNAVGGAMGAALMGLVLIPWLGMQVAVTVAALLSAVLGLFVLMAQSGVLLQARLNRLSVALVVVIAAMVGISPWEHKILSGGMYLYHENYARAAGLNPEAEVVSETARLMRSFELLLWEPGPMATVSVMRSPLGVKSLMINGKVDASASETEMGGDMKTQTAISLVPALLSQTHGAAYVVGLGSGVTAGALLEFPFQSMRVAEISPAVIRAAREFSAFNRSVVDNPRASVVAEDARHDLRASPRRYDLIVTQPSNLWIAGESSLYTQEWYALLASRLNPDGLVAQWLPAYNIAPENFAIVLHTLRQQFPSVTLWRTGGRGDLLAIASMQPAWMPAAIERAGERLGSSPALAQSLAAVGLGADPAAWLVADEGALTDWIRPFGPDLAINSDDRPATEFATPRDMFERRQVDDFIDVKERL